MSCGFASSTQACKSPPQKPLGLGLYRGYIGVNIGIMEKKMETTIICNIGVLYRDYRGVYLVSTSLVRLYGDLISAQRKSLDLDPPPLISHIILSQTCTLESNLQEHFSAD